MNPVPIFWRIGFECGSRRQEDEDSARAYIVSKRSVGSDQKSFANPYILQHKVFRVREDRDLNMYDVYGLSEIAAGEKENISVVLKYFGDSHMGICVELLEEKRSAMILGFSVFVLEK